MFKKLFHQRLIRITIYISILSCIGIAALIYFMGNITLQIRDARSFHTSGANIQKDLEKQLFEHQGKYGEMITKIFLVRPDIAQIIHFLESIEALSKEVRIKSNIKSIEKNAVTDLPETSPYLKYQIEFSTTIDKSIEFTEALTQKLPYYIKIDNFYLREDIENLPPGIFKIILLLKLYTK